MLDEKDSAPAPGPDQEIDRAQLLKTAIELAPVLLFFLANMKFGIFAATGVFMAATLAALAVSRIAFGRLPVMPLVTAVFVLVFGGLTLWLKDEHFIKVKPTIIYALFGAILLGGLLSGRTFLKAVFAEAFKLTEEGWRKLTMRWSVFFFGLAVLNEAVWRNVSTDAWVAFKTFAILPLIMVFAAAQVTLLRHYELK